MILIIDLCNNPLHAREFVKPIEDVLENEHIEYAITSYRAIDDKTIKQADKIIISGTSLADFDYLKHAQAFSFLKTFNNPVLGICGGMQLLCTTFDCKLVKGSEIGLKPLQFTGAFLGIDSTRDVYCLHNLAVKNDAAFKRYFDVYAKTKYIQAVKHKKKPFYGVLFHPEVRNKDMIRNFARM